jgi:hypothetical protein
MAASALYPDPARHALSCIPLGTVNSYMPNPMKKLKRTPLALRDHD